MHFVGQRPRVHSSTENQHPTLIVGGGGLGLETAIRLRQTGRRVKILERSPRLSNGATGRNLGGIQSGAVYVPKFPECVPFFREGVGLFRAMHPRAAVNQQSKWYVGFRDDIQRLAIRMNAHNIPFRSVPKKDLPMAFRPEVAHKIGALESPDEIVASSHRFVLDLTQRALELGVEIHLGTGDTHVHSDNGVVTGDATQYEGAFESDEVILVNGSGMMESLTNLQLGNQKAVAEVTRQAHVTTGRYFITNSGDNPFPHALHSVSDGIASLLNARNGMVFVERAGDVRTGYHGMLSAYRSGLVDSNAPIRSYTASDLKLVPDGVAHPESPPVPQILSPLQTRIAGLWAAHPGRMTFIPRTSFDLATMVHGDELPDGLILPVFDEGIRFETTKLVTPPPWAHGGAAFTQNGISDDCRSLIEGSLVS